MKCKQLACKCHLILKKITIPRLAHKLRRNICRKLHLTKKYAIKIDRKLHAALGTIPNMQCGPRKPASLTTLLQIKANILRVNKKELFHVFVFFYSFINYICQMLKCPMYFLFSHLLT